MNYKGYQIDRWHRIFKNGKQIFTVGHQRCLSPDQARALIDSSERARQLPDKQAALTKLSGMCGLESGSEKRERETDKMNEYFESLNNEL